MTRRPAPAHLPATRAAGPLLVITGPPGAGKSTVARILASGFERSALIEGDAFFGFLARGAVDPWLAEANEQNTVVLGAAAAAAGAFASGGCATVYDGVVGPWFLPTFGTATGLEHLDYLILLPPLSTCIRRVTTRTAHGFNDEPATTRMYAEFAEADVDERHLLRDPPEDAGDVAALIESARASGQLTRDVSRGATAAEARSSGA